jgi:hypothetical protein
MMLSVPARKVSSGRLEPTDRRDANGRNRRVSLVATRSGEGLLTEPVAGTRLRSRELALMPHTGPWFEFE